MPAVIAVILSWFTRYTIFEVLRYVFTGFLGIVSYSFMQRLIDKYINQFLAEVMNMEGIGMIMNISRLDDAISIIVGGMVVCAAIKAMGLKITSFGAG